MARRTISGFMMMPHDGELSKLPGCLDNLLRPGVSGIILPMFWKDLEPTKGKYNVDLIRQCVRKCASKGAKVIVQVRDKTFDPKKHANPLWLRREGRDVVYQSAWNSGHISKRWELQTAQYLINLHNAIHNRCKAHSHFVGTAMQETATGLAPGGHDKGYPFGYTARGYHDSLRHIALTIESKQPATQLLFYQNFLEGGNGLLKDLCILLAKRGVGIGGPDIIPGKKPLEQWCYDVMRALPADSYKFMCAQNDTIDQVAPWQVFKFAQEMDLDCVPVNHAPWMKAKMDAYFNMIKWRQKF